MDLILIIGIPGSGKSTKAREIITQYQANNLPIAHAWCQKKTEEAMQNNINVIVSNTSLTPKERRIYIELAKIYRYKVQVITMTNEFQNVHGVPPESLERMKKRYIPYDESELYF